MKREPLCIRESIFSPTPNLHAFKYGALRSDSRFDINNTMQLIADV